MRSLRALYMHRSPWKVFLSARAPIPHERVSYCMNEETYQPREAIAPIHNVRINWPARINDLIIGICAECPTMMSGV